MTATEAMAEFDRLSGYISRAGEELEAFLVELRRSPLQAKPGAAKICLGLIKDIVEAAVVALEQESAWLDSKHRSQS